MSRSCQRKCCCCWTEAVKKKYLFVTFLSLQLRFLLSEIITHFFPTPFLQMTLCVCSNTPHLHHTPYSSFCRMFSPVKRLQTSSTALTWWWWLTSLFDKYLIFHLETRWDLDTLHSYWLFSAIKGIVSLFWNIHFLFFLFPADLKINGVIDVSHICMINMELESAPG